VDHRSTLDVLQTRKDLFLVPAAEPTILVNLVNKANLVHNLLLALLFLEYLSISTCFWRLCTHHQEKQLCFCPKHVEINEYTKNKYTKHKLCTKLALFIRLYRDAGSTKQKKSSILGCPASSIFAMSQRHTPTSTRV